MILLNQADKRYNIDYSKPVKVYRNLHKGCWSVKQNGLVKAHSDKINLYDCSFLVNEKNRLKVIKEKRKNVHAFVRGYIWDTPLNLIRQASYNPYARNSFYDKGDGSSVYKAHFVKAIDGKLFYN
jgi:hypothetical protein